MKKMIGNSVLAMLVLFAMTVCDNTADGNNEDNNSPIHYDGPMTISGQQVWERNMNSNKVNEDLYFKFAGDADIIALTAFSRDADGIFSRAPKPAGSGKIINGILSLEAAVPVPENLVKEESLSIIFKEYSAVKVDPPQTMNNAIRIFSSDSQYYLNREGVFGLGSSLELEYIIFVYVDRDCRITGDPLEEGQTGSFIYRTDSPLDLSFKKGWNTLCRISIWDQSGFENVSMEIKNPNDFKWAIVKL